mmetsp:Transcript_2887/g.9724  ORF Transcript_2887/g.9724 Transcript_2887/m.9724 type:complete len:203 (-) Transcript_2887:2456-3064(-)
MMRRNQPPCSSLTSGWTISIRRRSFWSFEMCIPSSFRGFEKSDDASELSILAACFLVSTSLELRTSVISWEDPGKERTASAPRNPDSAIWARQRKHCFVMLAFFSLCSRLMRIFTPSFSSSEFTTTRDEHMFARASAAASSTSRFCSDLMTSVKITIPSQCTMCSCRSCPPSANSAILLQALTFLPGGTFECWTTASSSGML